MNNILSREMKVIKHHLRCCCQALRDRWTTLDLIILSRDGYNLHKKLARLDLSSFQLIIFIKRDGVQ